MIDREKVIWSEQKRHVSHFISIGRPERKLIIRSSSLKSGRLATFVVPETPSPMYKHRKDKKAGRRQIACSLQPGTFAASRMKLDRNQKNAMV
jgi:hypothetical protein